MLMKQTIVSLVDSDTHNKFKKMLPLSEQEMVVYKVRMYPWILN